MAAVSGDLSGLLTGAGELTPPLSHTLLQTFISAVCPNSRSWSAEVSRRRRRQLLSVSRLFPPAELSSDLNEAPFPPADGSVFGHADLLVIVCFSCCVVFDSGISALTSSRLSGRRDSPAGPRFTSASRRASEQKKKTVLYSPKGRGDSGPERRVDGRMGRPQEPPRSVNLSQMSLPLLSSSSFLPRFTALPRYLPDGVHPEAAADSAARSC